MLNIHQLIAEVGGECLVEDLLHMTHADGEKRALVLSNIGKDTLVELDLPHDFTVYLVDQEHLLTQTELNPRRFTLKENTVALIKNY